MGVSGAKSIDEPGKEAPASGGGLDWLAQAAQPESDAPPAAAGETRETGNHNVCIYYNTSPAMERNEYRVLFAQCSGCVNSQCIVPLLTSQKFEFLNSASGNVGETE